MIILFAYLFCLMLIFLYPSIMFNRSDTIENIKIYFINKDINKYSKIFINDKDYYIRKMIARKCSEKYLDILVNDEHNYVRQEVAERKINKYLDILVYNKDWIVRNEVARQGIDKYLDILIDDEDRNVKYSVADYGNLEHCKKLLQDKDEKVRNHAYNRIKEIEYNKLCQERNKERKLKQEALINNEINNKPKNKIIQYEIIQ